MDNPIDFEKESSVNHRRYILILVISLLGSAAIIASVLQREEALKEKLGPRVPQVDAVSTMGDADALCDRVQGGNSVNQVGEHFVCYDADGAPIARWIAGQQP